MLWLALLGWAVIDALLMALALALLVGRAFQYRSAPGEGGLAQLLLWPGLLLPGKHPVAVLLVSWVVWFVLGSAVIVILMRGG